MKLKVIMEIDTELYEEEFGIKIDDVDVFMERLRRAYLNPNVKSMTIDYEVVDG